MTGRIEKRVVDKPYLSFNSGYISIGEGVFSAVGEFTVEAQVRLPDTEILALRIIAADDELNGWAMSMGGGAQHGHFGLYHRRHSVVSLSDTGVIEVDLWYHVAIVYDTGTGLRTAYINGAASHVDTGPITSTAVDTGLILAIGGEGPADTGRHFVGDIADVRIWSTARTPTEIFDNRHWGSIEGTEAGLFGLWMLDADSGVQLDLGPNGNHGTVVRPNSASDVVFKQSVLQYSATKRVTGAVAAGNTQRVTAAATSNNEKAVITSGATTGTEFSTWKDTWGDKPATKETGALSFGASFLGWVLTQGGIKARPNPNNEKGFSGGPTETSEKRVTETPQS